MTLRVLLSRSAAEAVGPALREAAPDLTLVVLDGRTFTVDGAPLEREDVRPDVAWMSPDLFDSDSLRPFLGLARRAPTLRWLQASSAGLDQPVFAELIERGVTVTSSHVAGIPISEYVLRAVLDHFQQAERWREGQRAHRWQRHRFREVHGTTWLVIGMGDIGSNVATRAKAFGATVLGVRRSPRGDEPADEMLTPAELPGAIGRADVVVLCTPATPETENMVDSAFLARMREGSVLVNVGRGALVDEEALLAALDAGRPEAALLDVTRVEPLPEDHPFWDHPRVVLTPHSSAGDTSDERHAAVFVENFRRYVRGEVPTSER